MAKTEFIRARVEPELKYQAEEIFSKLGLSPTDAITLFYVQVTLHGGLPFEMRIPNTNASRPKTCAIRGKQRLDRFCSRVTTGSA